MGFVGIQSPKWHKKKRCLFCHFKGFGWNRDSGINMVNKKSLSLVFSWRALALKIPLWRIPSPVFSGFKITRMILISLITKIGACCQGILQKFAALRNRQ
jgi:hypothetical protein